MAKVKIFDTTLRDGEQSPGASLTIQEKLMIAKQLAKLGVDIIEAGFPIASQGDFEAVKLIAQKVKGPTICGLARCVPADIDRAGEALRPAKKKRIHVFIATSKIHMEKKIKKSKEEIMKMAVVGIKRAKRYTDDIEFSPEDASRTDMDYMCDVVRAAVNAGATTINVPDTVGYAQPEEFAQRIQYLQEKVPEIKQNNVTISVHCHDDLGLAVANSLAGVQAGARQIECTINGIGERAGNASLEECVMNLKVRGKHFKNITTGINTKEICKTSNMVSTLTGLAVQRNKAIVGKNAFAHESGIHQHGFIKAKETYEIMDAKSVGWVGEGIVIGKHSGKHAVEKVLREMGYELDKSQIAEVTMRIKELADKEKDVQKADIIAIANDVTNYVLNQRIILKDFAIMTGSNMTPTATVTLVIDGKETVGSAMGVGPVDAASNAIRTMIDPSLKLHEYTLKAITGGTDALAEVGVTLIDKTGGHFKGSAVNDDIVRASVEALIKGANYVFFAREKNGKK